MQRSRIHSASVALAVALAVSFACASARTIVLSSSFASGVSDPMVGASTSAGDESELPSNVLVPRMIRPLVSEMLKRSVTFRGQCSKIRNAPVVRIVIELVPSLTYDQCLAISLVTRYAYGRIEIRILITAPRAPVSYAEIIGHEFEHALEQIEGLDLSTLASTRGSCVYRHADGSFETRRAQEAGVAVAREFDQLCKASNSAASPGEA